MNHDLESWDKAAINWDKNIAIDGSYRTLLIKQALSSLMPEVSNLKILDAGCGNGYLTNWLFGKGAAVLGIDGSSEMIKMAQQKYPNLNFKIIDLLQPLPNELDKYDVIIANMLLMHLSDVKVFLNSIRDHLTNNGKFIFSVLHPCFNYPTAKLYKGFWQKILFSKPSALVQNYYSRQIGRHESHLNTDLTHYHRTLEEYSHLLNESGLVIERLLEPHQLPENFLKNNPKLEYATRIPRFLFFSTKVL